MGGHPPQITNMEVSSTAGGSLCTQWSVGKFFLAFPFLELTHTLLGKAVSDLSSGSMDGFVETCAAGYTLPDRHWKDMDKFQSQPTYIFSHVARMVWDPSAER